MEQPRAPPVVGGKKEIPRYPERCDVIANALAVEAGRLPITGLTFPCVQEGAVARLFRTQRRNWSTYDAII